MLIAESYARLAEEDSLTIGSEHLHFNRIPAESGSHNSLELMD